jgi:hypothetical protein
MKLKRRFSIGYFSLEVIFISRGLGFLTVLIHAPVQMEYQFLVIPIIGACWGAALGGIWDNILEGAKAGLVAGFALLPPPPRKIFRNFFQIPPISCPLFVPNCN